jgi:hypothetical protein
MRVQLKDAEQAIQLAKRMVFLAYNAAGGARGMGVFQAGRAGSNPEEERVWQCAYNAEDYCGRMASEPDNKIFCDYVFGSMIKWGCQWDDNVVSMNDNIFRPDYQGFARTYQNNAALVEAALKSLEITDAVML